MSRRLCKKSAWLLVFLWVFAVFCGGGAGAARAEPQPILADTRAEITRGLRLIKQEKWAEARQVMASTRNPLAARLYYWFWYREGSPDEAAWPRLSNFVRQADNWPDHNTLRLRVEGLMPVGLSAGEVAGWFDRYEPLTHEGVTRYILALLRVGQEEKAASVAREWWHTALITPDEQKAYERAFGRFLRAEDHKIRFSRLLANRHYTNARAVAMLLGKGYPQLAEARIRLAEGQAGVDAAIDAVPPYLQDDPGLLLERLQWRRRNDRTVGAMEILHNMPDPVLIHNDYEWWRERHIIARRLIKAEDYRSAYMLVSAHKQEEGLGFAEAEFLAGWLALRFLDKPHRAFEHFEALYHRTSTPISRSRGAYWAGRASEALGHKGIAEQWYRTAAQHRVAFYGQLAWHRLPEGSRPALPPPPERNAAAERAFRQDEMALVISMLAQAGLRDETEMFVRFWADRLDEGEHFLYLAELSEALGYQHMALAVAKEALGDGVLLFDHAFPSMMRYMPPNLSVDVSLIHGLMRQESAFDQQARSPVGAMGLMQLMPDTARDVARELGLSFNASWLTGRPEYNIRLGSAYLARRLKQYDRSVPLALAAYNAGAGRVNEWMREFGDPRTKDVDMIDWIERVPFGETRNYIQRVMEATYLYRQKFKEISHHAAANMHTSE